MAVYLIRAGEHGPVKIGYSDEPEVRLGQLQISHWETLRIIRQFEGGPAEETALHDRFQELHIRGEWHHFSRAMLGDVGLVEITGEPDAPVAAVAFKPIEHETITDPQFLGARIREMRKAKGLTQIELAQAIGVARSSLACIETGKDAPGREVLLRVGRFFNIGFDLPKHEGPQINGLTFEGMAA